MQSCPKRLFTSCLRASTFAALLACAGSSAQTNEGKKGAEAGQMQDLSRAQFAQRVERLQEAVRSCRADSRACRADVGQDSRVSAEGTQPAVLQHWQWLRDAMGNAAKAGASERANLMDRAADRLAEVRERSSPEQHPHNSTVLSRARAKVDEVLSRAEFQPAIAAEPSWLDRMLSQIQLRIASLLLGARRIGEQAPWIGKLLEWTLFLSAATCLLLFIKRSFARQQLRIAIAAGPMQTSAWDREANDWAAEAEAWAKQFAWRDAVHCLYWAAIVKLEARRAWKHNPARTPREYVRLLQQGSAQQISLRGLTGIFERTWYGLRDAQISDYTSAKAHFAELSQGATTLQTGAVN